MDKDLELRKEIGGRIKKIRCEMDMTKDSLAKALGITGQFLGVVESGRSAMSYENLKKLCDMSGYTADYILYGRDAHLLYDTGDLLQEFSERELQDACELIKKMAAIIRYKHNQNKKCRLSE